MRVLVDTDIFIDHLRGATEFRRGPNDVSYSVVTRCELYAGRTTREAVIDRLLAPYDELPIDRAIAQRAGRLRGGTFIRTPDALVAATAIEHRLTLLTRNVRDYAEVRGLHMSRRSV
ncbi:MAG: type II toxin-antitoxin system VapC family toxin [Candidatus Dormibacteraeota bacterium]|nr:type II toxin-antitoxin system VapC family toxin [Candidatus Dormibacteraeota bacterium]MBV9524968.1 type II toxin-antitoxin system VapC family toxin [Candidatus Dormibacteraeota bacterium]